MDIQFSTPNRINDVLSASDATRLTRDELLLTIPVDFKFVEGAATVYLREAPLLGVIEQLVDVCERLRSGEPSARMLDVYGEYELLFTCQREKVRVEELTSALSLETSLESLFAATVLASHRALDSVLVNLPAIASNASFIALQHDLRGAGRRHLIFSESGT
jgi:hypothetical protein